MEQIRMAPISTPAFIVGKTAALSRALADRRDRDHRRGDGASSTCRCAATGCRSSLVVALFLIGALGTGLLVSTMRRHAAGRVSGGGAHRDAADADPVRVHLSDREHAGGRCSTSPRSCRRATSSSRCAASCSRGSDLADLVWPIAGALGVYAVVVLALVGSQAGTPMRPHLDAHRGRSSSSCGGRRSSCGSSSSRPSSQLTMLGYAATTDVHDVPIVVVDGDRSPRSRQLIERFAASPLLPHRRRGACDPADDRRRPGEGRAWLAHRDSGRTSGERSSAQRAGAAPGRCRSSPTAPTPTRPASRSATCRGSSRSSTRRSAAERGRRPAGDRRPGAGLVQPRAREPQLHGAGRAGAAAPASSPPT